MKAGHSFNPTQQLMANSVSSAFFHDQHEMPALAALAALPEEKLEESIIPAFAIIARVNSKSDLGQTCVSIGKAVADSAGLGKVDTETAIKIGITVYQAAQNASIIDDEEMDDDRLRRELMAGSPYESRAVRPLLEPPVFRSIFHDASEFYAPATFNQGKTDYPMIANSLVKLNSQAWRINSNILELASFLFMAKSNAFGNIWGNKHDIAKASRCRLVRTIIEFATEVKDVDFYNKYFLDFRGRIYPCTSFLNAQSIDIAKGLLQLSRKERLGIHGEKWLKLGLANTWANASASGVKTDKLPILDRLDWVFLNYTKLIEYATNPVMYPAWQDADSPFQFLSYCMELKKLGEWIDAGNNPEDFETGIVIYIDGSTNGSQHLAALTRDEVTAPYVNLVPQSVPGDLYSFIAVNVWAELEKEVAIIPTERRWELLVILDGLRVRQERSNQSDLQAREYSEARKACIEYCKEYSEEIKEGSALFFHSITSAGERRKVVKRGVMTITYGATAYGMGMQVLEDFERHSLDEHEQVTHGQAMYMGSLIYSVALVHMEKCMYLLNVFKESGARKGRAQSKLSWTVPFTGLRVVQQYSEGIMTEYTAKVADRIFKIKARSRENREVKTSKQKSGAAPNVIHSLDAAHMTMVIDSADYSVVPVHDSFGTTPGNMEDLFHRVREEFVRLYRVNPLPALLQELGVDDKDISYGTLDINDLLYSDFCFI